MKLSTAMLKGYKMVDYNKAAYTLYRFDANNKPVAACALGCAGLGVHGAPSPSLPPKMRVAIDKFEREYGVDILTCNDRYRMPIDVIAGMLKAINE